MESALDITKKIRTIKKELRKARKDMKTLKAHKHRFQDFDYRTKHDWILDIILDDKALIKDLREDRRKSIKGWFHK
jgi:hypothetical protein